MPPLIFINIYLTSAFDSDDAQAAQMEIEANEIHHTCLKNPLWMRWILNIIKRA